MENEKNPTTGKTQRDLVHAVWLNGASDVTAYTGFSAWTIFAWVHDRKIPFRKVGSRLVFRRDELDAWIEKRK